ncbi:glutamine synthetase family protein [uncultured Nocardioides sp.]|uniref:glutamine synthetase family protein n=1 Tax=uncultured Nocardioides sp. TaxID=198441 RepID=UPI00261C180F|nr:glutamine synthetase family protein [uncultured Nocardioides sp.]
MTAAGAHPDRAVDAEELARRLSSRDVVGVTIGWVDNNGVVRSRTVPTAELPAAVRRGVGNTTAFAVFDSHDGITFAHEGLATPSGDVRLVPVVDGPLGVTATAGQPGFAFVPGRQLTGEGEPWAYDQRAVLERQLDRAADAGLGLVAGFEMEMVVSHEDDPLDRDGEVRPAQRGPAYSANAVRDVGEFCRSLLADLAADGVRIGQLHAEYGGSQVEMALSPLPGVGAADAQVLARQTAHNAARKHGLRLSFAPVTLMAGAGNGWHLHTSLTGEDGRNALTGDGPHGLSPTGLGYVAGLLAELPGITAVTAPSTGSLLRRRPGFWASAFGFWGVENREAALRLVPSSALLGPDATNVELKASDASANPYLSLAVVLAAGLAGVESQATPPEPIGEDVGTWSEEEREAAGITPLASTAAQAREDLLGSALVREVLGDDLLGAFVACRDADAAWAAPRPVDEVVASLRWLY